jgi:S-adenosylmethionine hydrolase
MLQIGRGEEPFLLRHLVNVLFDLSRAHGRKIRAFHPFRKPFVRTRLFGRFYAEVPPGKPIALIGSSNRVELCVNGGGAAKQFHAKTGDAVRVS